MPELVEQASIPKGKPRSQPIDVTDGPTATTQSAAQAGVAMTSFSD